MISSSTRTKRLSILFDDSSTSVWQTLRAHQLYPFHVTPVQDFLPQDYNKRRCLPMVNHTMHTRSYLLELLMVTNAYCFTKNDITHFRKTHTWAEETVLLVFFTGIHGFLENISLANLQELWFIYDNASAHYSHVVVDYLNTTYGNR